MRYAIAAAIVIGYLVATGRIEIPNGPDLTPNVPKPPVAEIAQACSQLSQSEKSKMTEAYLVFSRAVAADPAEDSVFSVMGDVRRAHRSILLWMWRGYLDREPGSAPGLGEALEGAFSRLIGKDDEPLNPSRRAEIAKSLQDIANSFQ
jgi:hypothetical protein